MLKYVITKFLMNFIISLSDIIKKTRFLRVLFTTKMIIECKNFDNWILNNILVKKN